MDSVEVEQVEWLLYPFIPYGKVTIIPVSYTHLDVYKRQMQGEA